MFAISHICMSEIVKLCSEGLFFSTANINKMSMCFFGQILMNVKNCLDFAKEENVLIRLGASSVSVHQGTTWMRRLECVMVWSFHLTRLLLYSLKVMMDQYAENESFLEKEHNQTKQCKYCIKSVKIPSWPCWNRWKGFFYYHILIKTWKPKNFFL